MHDLTLSSTAFEHGQEIPKKFTGEGEDVSPALTWTNLPAGTKEVALIMDDPDAPTSDPWVHWVIYNISAGLKGLPEGLAKTPTLTSPIAATQGHNTWPKIGYNGPMPPKGHGVHHYHFKLYALKKPLNLPPDLSKKSLLAAIQDNTLGEGELVGTYERK